MTSNSTVQVSKGSKENGRWITEQSILFKIAVLGFAVTWKHTLIVFLFFIFFHFDFDFLSSKYCNDPGHI